MAIAHLHTARRRDQAIASVVSLLVHVLLGLGALFMQLRDRTVPERGVLLELQSPPPALPAEAPRAGQREETAREAGGGHRSQVAPPRAVRSAPAGRVEMASDERTAEMPVVIAPVDEVCVDTLPPVISTSSALVRMSQEEAFGELLRLLEKHPEFKEAILREMLAGDGAVAPVPKLEIVGLEQLLALHKGKLALPGAGSRALGGVNPNPTYSPIHGTNPNPVAGSFNYIGLLLKLISLIRGE